MLKNKKEVIKPSAAIQISNKITLLQRRCWNFLLANAYDELPKKEIYEISIADLTNVLCFDSGNVEYLKKSLENILKCTVKWNILNKDGKEKWGLASLLSEVEIEDGLIRYAYSPTLREKLYNPSMYARINLSMQNRFDSKYTLALYELAVDYLIVKIGSGQTPYISIFKLRELLGFKKDQYMVFKSFNRDILKKAINEINKKSDLFVEMGYKRERRKVVSIKFIIKVQNNQKLLIKNIKNDEFLKIFTTLQKKFLLSPSQAEIILEKYKDLSILEILLIEIEQKYKNGEIKNLGAYSFQMLKEHTGIVKSEIDKDKEKEKRELKEQKERIKKEQLQIKKLKDEFDQNKQQKINKYIEENRETISEFFPEFKEKYSFVLKTFLNKEELENNDLFRKALNKQTHILGMFRVLLAEKILEPQDNNFIQFAKSKNIEIVKKVDDYYLKNGETIKALKY
jgi:plasmid replication initiation protein